MKKIYLLILANIMLLTAAFAQTEYNPANPAAVKIPITVNGATRFITGGNLTKLKQDVLTSGTNIKTINGVSALGSGNISTTGIAPFLGFTSGGIPPDAVASSGTVQQVMARKMFWARSAMTSPRPVFALGWYVSSTNTEVVQTGSYQIRASIEYPIGTYTQLTFGGLVTGTYSGGQNVIPDAPNINIPNGALYAVKWWVSSPNGWVYSNNAPSIAGDFFSVGTTTPDLTMSAMSGTSSVVVQSPLGVIDITYQKSFGIIGDSINQGQNTDERDNSGLFGISARIVGAKYAAVNLSRSSTLANQYTTANTAIRSTLYQYFTDIVSNFGINDCLSNIPAATTVTELVRIRNLFSSKRFYQTTITPLTNGASSAWVLMDGSDQVLNTNASPIRLTLNGLIRLGGVVSGANTFTGVIDVANAVQHPTNASKWVAGSTADGIHPLGTGGWYRIIAQTVYGRDLLLY